VSKSSGSLLISVRTPPYSHGRSRTTIELALASAAFEHPATLLFAGDGVLQLLPLQDSTGIGRRNISRLLSSLPLYDIDRVYVDATAARRYQLNLATAPLNCTEASSAEMRELMLSHDHLLGF
tara:strand:- start:17051 stop:17419 length:369 start_codon:yes stop_codon:yes gene_type:complete